jgi:antitoxin component of MazEF toxin-antitoxin module
MQEIRKIGKIGDYTRIISLPLFWLRIVGLDAGDHVEITIGKNKELIVKPHRGEKDD